MCQILDLIFLLIGVCASPRDIQTPIELQTCLMAAQTVMSRALGVTVQQAGENRRLCRLVPFVDLVNHAGDVTSPLPSNGSPQQHTETNIECATQVGLSCLC